MAIKQAYMNVLMYDANFSQRNYFFIDELRETGGTVLQDCSSNRTCVVRLGGDCYTNLQYKTNDPRRYEAIWVKDFK